jgi:hypothetical protein
MREEVRRGSWNLGSARPIPGIAFVLSFTPGRPPHHRRLAERSVPPQPASLNR